MQPVTPGTRCILGFDMEMHQLRYFLAVVRAGNFSRAAAECHVSQPSLSQQIIKLEEELGEPLFERLPRGVGLTPPAHILQPVAERILSGAEDARRMIRQARGDVRGKVTVGVLPTVAPYLLPPLLRSFAARFPHAGVIVQEDTTAGLLAQIENVTLDMALLSLPVAAPFLTSVRLFDDELLLAMPGGHPLADAKSIALRDLAGADFILLRDGHCLADQTEEFCVRFADFCPKVACRSAQMETVLTLIRSGMGVSLVPAMAAKPEYVQDLVLRSLTPKLYRQIGLAWKRNRNHCLVARGFRECAEAIGVQRLPRESVKVSGPRRERIPA